MKKYCEDIKNGLDPSSPGSCLYDWVDGYDGDHDGPGGECESASVYGFTLIEDWNDFLNRLETKVVEIGGGPVSSGCDVVLGASPAGAFVDSYCN